jgi:hypothetical protein
MNLWTFALAAVFLILLLWVAYRIGKIILRILLGLLLLGLLAGIAYSFFFQHHQRSSHVRP